MMWSGGRRQEAGLADLDRNSLQGSGLQGSGLQWKHLGGGRRLWWTFSVHNINIHTQGYATSMGLRNWSSSWPCTCQTTYISYQPFLAPYSLALSRSSVSLRTRKGKREGGSC